LLEKKLNIRVQIRKQIVVYLSRQTFTFHNVREGNVGGENYTLKIF
jgi:hypothetical protein